MTVKQAKLLKRGQRMTWDRRNLENLLGATRFVKVVNVGKRKTTLVVKTIKGIVRVRPVAFK